MSQVKIFTLFFFFITSFYTTHSQSLSRELVNLPMADRVELARFHAHELKDAILIIILPYHERKINQLQEWLRDSTTPPQRISRIEKLLEITISNRDSLNFDYIRNFPRNYSFSEIKFLYNKDLNRFLEKGTKEYFLGPDGNYNGSKETLKKKVYFGHLYRERGEDTAGGYYFVLSDTDFNIIPKPFPSFINLENTFLNILTFWNGDSFNIPAEKIGERVEKKLNTL